MDENNNNSNKYLVDPIFDNGELLADSIRAEVELSFRDFEREKRKIEKQKNSSFPIQRKF